MTTALPMPLIGRMAYGCPSDARVGVRCCLGHTLTIMRVCRSQEVLQGWGGCSEMAARLRIFLPLQLLFCLAAVTRGMGAIAPAGRARFATRRDNTFITLRQQFSLEIATLDGRLMLCGPRQRRDLRA